MIRRWGRICGFVQNPSTPFLPMRPPALLPMRGFVIFINVLLKMELEESISHVSSIKKRSMFCCWANSSIESALPARPLQLNSATFNIIIC